MQFVRTEEEAEEATCPLRWVQPSRFVWPSNEPRLVGKYEEYPFNRLTEWSRDEPSTAMCVHCFKSIPNECVHMAFTQRHCFSRGRDCVAWAMRYALMQPVVWLVMELMASLDGVTTPGMRAWMAELCAKVRELSCPTTDLRASIKSGERVTAWMRSSQSTHEYECFWSAFLHTLTLVHSNALDTLPHADAYKPCLRALRQMTPHWDVFSKYTRSFELVYPEDSYIHCAFWSAPAGSCCDLTRHHYVLSLYVEKVFFFRETMPWAETGTPKQLLQWLTCEQSLAGLLGQYYGLVVDHSSCVFPDSPKDYHTRWRNFKRGKGSRKKDVAPPIVRMMLIELRGDEALQQSRFTVKDHSLHCTLSPRFVDQWDAALKREHSETAYLLNVVRWVDGWRF